MPDLSNLVALDFETYSDVDLKKYGLDNYTQGKHFKVLLAGIARLDPHGKTTSTLIDFVNATSFESAVADLNYWLEDKTIVAHNAAFEREVLKALGLVYPVERFIDTAVLARAAGFSGTLENTARQALMKNKHPEGERLVKQFCLPSKEQVEDDRLAFEAYNKYPLNDWVDFGIYCVMDAELSLELMKTLPSQVLSIENTYAQITMSMNEVGWPVDLELVQLMNQLYKENLKDLEHDFRVSCDAHDLNLNSSQQLIAWCKERGVTTKSFDEKSVERMLKQVNKRIVTLPMNDPKQKPLREVHELLTTKQALGGSSLKKLDVIENTTGADNRLRNQYMHLGASATYRTSGRGVQMQNLKRLHGEGDNVGELLSTPPTVWSNEKLASNLRQCFRSSDPVGALVVGDFSSVESRGLAWQAAERWKLDAYFNGEDLYKVQAANMFGMPVSAVGKAERQIGKVAELSCGYGAGPGAVKDFADKMGVTLSEAEATKLVRDWRDANQEIVQYWKDLDSSLHRALHDGYASVGRPHMMVSIERTAAPESLAQQVGNETVHSLQIKVSHAKQDVVSRVIHGVYEDGNNLGYYKPSERKTGDPWLKDYIDPKTKRRRTYNIYGGKLAGILTQSLCREIFFTSLLRTHRAFYDVDNVALIGQFHDEIVLDWTSRKHPHSLHEASMQETLNILNRTMTTSNLAGFPLGADIKSAYRYIK